MEVNDLVYLNWGQVNVLSEIDDDERELQEEYQDLHEQAPSR